MLSARVKVDAKLKSIAKEIAEGVDDGIKELALKGTKKAIEIAPKKTYSMVDAVGYIYRGDSATIFAKTPTGQTRPYHMYMHGLAGYDTSAQKFSGEPKFMFKTAEYLADIAEQTINIQLKEI